MGTVEGLRVIPPIAGRFLFQSRAQTSGELDGQHTRGPDLAHAFGKNRVRPPYTHAAAIRAIREGADAGGGTLDGLMPRYALTDSEAQSLVDYLESLSSQPSPGVERDALHFATVVAPGVDPARRKALLDVLEQFFAVRNMRNQHNRMRQQNYAESMHATYRQWKLHVWDLRGPPETWQSQLLAYELHQPVFALLSGVSEGTWAPVHEFCERRRVPCWFPTVDVPAASEQDFYSFYFYKGVALEPEILARSLDPGVRRVIEVRGSDAGAARGAQALETALRGSGIPLVDRVLGAMDAAALRNAVADATSSDAIVWWLRARNLPQLADVPPPAASVYFSATLVGAERAPLPASWKARARLIYPFELPEPRGKALARFHAWRVTRGMPLVDERLQADAYLASQLLSEKIDELLETLQRDYLVERAEGILSMRLTTGMYHRLSLGPGQRFASKGGYIARFATPDGAALVAERDWIVP
jgi:hypothetical protein